MTWRRRTPPKPRWLGRPGAGPVRDRGSRSALVATLYLAEIATRYLRDGQAEAGARLGDVGNWLLPVLLRHARELGAGPS